MSNEIGIYKGNNDILSVRNTLHLLDDAKSTHCCLEKNQTNQIPHKLPLKSTQ